MDVRKTATKIFPQHSDFKFQMPDSSGNKKKRKLYNLILIVSQLHLFIFYVGYMSYTVFRT